MTVELKPCPFCGGAPNIASHSGDERVGYVTTWVLTCIKCGARKSATDTTDKNGWSNAKPEETKLRAIAAWNRRATPDPLSDPRVKALVEAAKEMFTAFYSNGDVTDRHLRACKSGVKLEAALNAIEEGGE